MKLLQILSLLFATTVIGQNIFYNYSAFIDQSIEKFGFYNVTSNFVTFQLFTRNTTTPIQIQTGQLNNVQQLKLNQKLIFITHGYLHNSSSPWVLKMKDEYLKKDDFNVISVNWSKPASAFYPLSAGYTKCVGQFFGQLLYDFNKTLNVPYSNMHLVGHSLGAHVSGFAGKYIQQYGYKVARISGCDPAGPLFNLASSQNKLAKTDATFVDVIHTDGLKYGHLAPLGDIDFYPNGGIAPQPGCNALSINNEIIIGCSHIRSYQLFTDSINSNTLLATSCPNWAFYILKLCQKNTKVIMGENVNQIGTGLYELTTNKASPYGRNGTI